MEIRAMAFAIQFRCARRSGNSQSKFPAQTLPARSLRLAVWFTVFLWPVSVCAQQEGDWVGKRVVQKHSNFQLENENRVVGTKNTFNVYRVEKVNGSQLWLRSAGNGLAGWAPADQVVPVEQAVEFFTGYIRSYPADPHGYTMRANIWRQEKGDYDTALGDYNEAIRLTPTAAAYNNRGLAWWDKKDHDRAIADYDEAIKLDRGLAAAYNNRGLAWSDKKDHDRAIADYNEAIKLDHGLAGAYSNRGLAWSDKKDYDKAIADYNEAITLDPAVAWAYNNRAWLMATCPVAKYRDGKMAVESAKTACELSEWREPYHIGTLAAAHAEAANFDEAVKWQTKANAVYTDADDRRDGEERIKLYRDKKPYRETTP
jgi:tetratricopeptide (TPR) repeat protein